MNRHRQGVDPRVVGPAIADPFTSHYATIGILSYSTRQNRIEGYEQFAKQRAEIFRTRPRSEWIARLGREVVPFGIESDSRPSSGPASAGAALVHPILDQLVDRITDNATQCEAHG